jgi:hypothetical protein
MIILWYAIITLIVVYLFFFRKSESDILREELENIHSIMPKWHRVEYVQEDDLHWVLYKWKDRVIGSANLLYMYYFVCGMIHTTNKSKRTK